MIRILRLIFLPIFVTIGLAGLAVTEWSKVSKRRDLAESFHSNSKVVSFTSVGSREFGGKSVPTYEYEEDGLVKVFPTLRSIPLPPGGNVRMGNDPRPRPQTSLMPIANEELPMMVVPINGQDTMAAVYQEFWDASEGEDITRAIVVSLAALVAGVAAFFLQRAIFSGLRNARFFR